MGSEGEVFVDGADEGVFAELSKGLGEVVRHEAEVTREQALLKLGCLPARQVIMEPVEEGRVDHRLRQVGKEVGGADKLLVRLTRVSYEDNRCLCWRFLL